MLAFLWVQEVLNSLPDFLSDSLVTSLPEQSLRISACHRLSLQSYTIAFQGCLSHRLNLGFVSCICFLFSNSHDNFPLKTAPRHCCLSHIEQQSNSTLLLSHVTDKSPSHQNLQIDLKFVKNVALLLKVRLIFFFKQGPSGWSLGWGFSPTPLHALLAWEPHSWRWVWLRLALFGALSIFFATFFQLFYCCGCDFLRFVFLFL